MAICMQLDGIKARRGQPANRGRLAMADAPFVGRAEISAAVPTRLRSSTPTALLSRFALLLLETGLIPPQRWVRSKARLASICTESLSDWIEQRTGTLQVLKACFGATVERDHGGEGDAGRVTVAWAAEAINCIEIGAAMTALAAINPRLPGTVLSAIRMAGWNSIPVFAFDDQIDFCECYLWGGENSEVEYAEAYGIHHEDIADFLESTIRRGDILGATPAEAFEYCRRQFPSERSLARFHNAVESVPVRRILELVREIRAIGEVDMVRSFHRAASEEGGDFVGFGAVLRWNGADRTVDVLDRLQQMEFESGTGFEECGVQYLPLRDAEAFASFLGDLSRVLRHMRCLDELLWLLCAEEWSSYSSSRD